MRCYRIVRPRYAESALSGEGARLYGGRWSPVGFRCVYTAESRSLGVLEMLVHLTGRSRALPYLLLTVEVPDELIAESEPLPDGWDALPAGSVSQTAGETWLEAGKTPALRVPSVIVPEETNLLLNPEASGFEKIRVTGQRTFQIDLRLAADSA